GIDALVLCGEPLPEFDAELPLMSVPRVLGTSLRDLPPPPGLPVDPAAAAVFAERLGRLPGPRIGLAWTGNPQHPNNARRSIEPADLAPLVRTPGRSWFNLQYGVEAPTLPLAPVADGPYDLADAA